MLRQEASLSSDDAWLLLLSSERGRSIALQKLQRCEATATAGH